MPASTDDLAAIIETQVRELLESTVNDARQYARAIAADMAGALLLPPPRRDALLAELVAQLKAVGEINRIRANNAQWLVFTRVVNVLVSALVAAA